MIANKSYAICTLPRSGSNYLCQLISSTGQLGKPDEYFNAQGQQSLGQQLLGQQVSENQTYPNQRDLQIQKILSAGTTANGVYGLKLFPNQHDRIRRYVDWNQSLPNLKFIFLKRYDILGQAISWKKVSQTGQFRSDMNSKNQLHYNKDYITKRLRDIVRLNARWELYFAQNGLQPLRLHYETIVEAPQATIDQISQFLQVKDQCAIDFSKIGLEIQSDQTSRDWRDRYLAESKTPNFIPKLGRSFSDALGSILAKL